MTFWFDGAASGSEDLFVPPSAGALLGWGVFTTLGIWQGRPFALDRHLARLRRDAERARVPLAHDDATLAKALRTAISKSGIIDGIARITATRRGDGRWNTAAGCDLSLALNAIAGTARSAPVTLQLSQHRIEPRRPLAGVKSTSYLDYQLAWLEAHDNGFDDALLCNSSGALCECSRSNLFWVRDGALFTPSQESGCLPGIGRALILEWAAEEGIPIKQGAFSPHELQLAEEVFITASTTGPRAVRQLQLAEDWELGWETTGAVTQQLQGIWSEAAGSH